MAAAKMAGLTPGFKFEPSDEQLVQFFLLPYLRELPVPLGGLVIRDDPRSVPPWKLFARNGRGDEEDAYFLAPADGEGRQARTCDGGRGRWIAQRLERTGDLRLAGGGGGEAVMFEKHRLNYHAGEGRCGSTGWVMHEYAVVKPAALGARHRACHIAFTGHGQKRKRVPDGYVDVEDDGSKASTSAAAAAAVPPSSTAAMSTSPSNVAYNQEYHISPEQSIQQHFPAEHNNVQIQQQAYYQSQYHEQCQYSDEEKYLLQQIKQEQYYYNQQNCFLPGQGNQELYYNNDAQQQIFSLPEHQCSQEQYCHHDDQQDCVLPEQHGQELHGYNNEEQGYLLPPEPIGKEEQAFFVGGEPQHEKQPLTSTSQQVLLDHDGKLLPPVGVNGAVAIPPQDAAVASNDDDGGQATEAPAVKMTAEEKKWFMEELLTEGCWSGPLLFDQPYYGSALKN
uniref:NAC domain-containing protein n=1 Tax=Oryza meridionalis TaxID=40149 RepID=A0A0E0CFH5_9ORYZ